MGMPPKSFILHHFTVVGFSSLSPQNLELHPHIFPPANSAQGTPRTGAASMTFRRLRPMAAPRDHHRSAHCSYDGPPWGKNSEISSRFLLRLVVCWDSPNRDIMIYDGAGYVYYISFPLRERCFWRLCATTPPMSDFSSSQRLPDELQRGSWVLNWFLAQIHTFLRWIRTNRPQHKHVKVTQRSKK